MEIISDCDFFSTLNARVIPKKVNAAEIMNPARFISNTKDIMEPTTIRKARLVSHKTTKEMSKSELAKASSLLTPFFITALPV